ncbi:unnamed protein product [Brassicogethes aeneus]|nr:unnamed protein product [Brassicogethes aeneus]
MTLGTAKNDKTIDDTLKTKDNNTTESHYRKKIDDFNTTITNIKKESSNNYDAIKINQHVNENKRTIDDDSDLRSAMNSKQRELDEAVLYGIKSMQDLYEKKELMWYKMGLTLEKNHPASFVAKFGAPNERALKLSRFGYAALEATVKIAETYPNNVGRENGFPEAVQSRLLLDECPLKGTPRCSQATRRYRTADGTCNNLRKPWRGSAMLPLQRFMPPVYEDGIQSIRRSVFNSRRLPSPRSISTRVHRDKNQEIQSVTLLFMQWGQFIDHDITSTVKSRSFNGSIPRCCDQGGRGFLPPELMHPACLPIEVSSEDWFYSHFGIRCLEFLRSAPSTRIDCDLGWREQINQVTPFIDTSTIYGSDIETSDSMRTFRNGKLIYGRPRQGPLNPPDPPGGEICRSGAISSDCFRTGDGRSDEQPALTALHTVWVRYHNKIANVLGKLNLHWSDEKTYQETRKIVYSVVQHITYREFLPIVVGQDVMELFELNLVRKGYYNGYDDRVNPQIANAFSAAAFRFGHSMVQNTYVRADSDHRPIFNNVSLHLDPENSENIWRSGSVDRLILGLVNQPSQRRDEFVCEELTNHLFQFSDTPFGMDLAAINIQRGRDHGLPPYTSWREPCGLSPIKSWDDLKDIIPKETLARLQSLYDDIDDIDLFTGGLAEKPLRGGVVGPTFACIIAQQFLLLRKGDKFWYENGNFESSFTPAQLQQVRHVTLAQVLCQTMDSIETIQPFAFLSHDNFRNIRLPCDSPSINTFDLSPWSEIDFKDSNANHRREGVVEARAKSTKDCDKKRTKRRKTQPNKTRPTSNSIRRSTTASSVNKRTTTRRIRTTERPLKIPIVNVTTNTVQLETKDRRPIYSQPLQYYDEVDKTRVTYLFGLATKTTPAPVKAEKPLELNIKIQYYLPTTTTTKKPTKRKRTKRPNVVDHVSYPIFVQQTRPSDYYNTQTTARPNDYYQRPQIFTNNDYQHNYNDDHYNRPIDRPNVNVYVSTEKPYAIRPNTYYDSFNYGHTTKKTYKPYNNDLYVYDYTTQRNPYNNKPSYVQGGYNRGDPEISDVYSQLYNDGQTNPNIPMKPTFGQFTTDDKPNKGHIHKLDNHHNFHPLGTVQKLDDKLDFKTRFVYNQQNDDDDGRFIKISSVKSDQIVTNTKQTYLHTVQSRDDEVDLLDVNDTDTAMINNKRNGLRLVEIDVQPDEIRNEQWLIYNATDETMPLVTLPDINTDISCSKEVPKPMTLHKRKSRQYG